MELFRKFIKKIDSIEGTKEVHFFSRKNGHDIYSKDHSFEAKKRNKDLFNETNKLGGIILIVAKSRLNLISIEEETKVLEKVFAFKIKKDKITSIDHNKRDLFLKSIYGNFIIKN